MQQKNQEENVRIQEKCQNINARNEYQMILNGYRNCN
jgi:hypothetical protein